MSLQRLLFLSFFSALGAMSPGRLEAEELYWNWALDLSYDFEQEIEMVVLSVDDNRSSRNEIAFSQTVSAAAREISNGAKLTMSFSEPHFRAATRVNRRTRKFDSKLSSYATHPAWNGVQSEHRALENASRVATFDRKGRLSVVSGLGRYPKLSTLPQRGFMGRHSEALLAFSTGFLPTKPVQVGDTWTVELPNRFKEMLELKEPIAKVSWSADATFDKVVTRWKRDHASISYTGAIDLASRKDSDFPFARYSIAGSFLWDLEKGLEVESEMKIRLAPHPALVEQAKTERFWYSMTSTAKQRLVKVKPL